MSSELKHENLSQKYQKKELHDQILVLPDTYIGSVEPSETKIWVYDTENKNMEKRNITFSGGLYKIFDEILVNACDQHIRLKNDKKCKKSDQVTTIKVNIKNDEISVYNNGTGIPVDIHPEYDIYIPELIFGNLLTSENYAQDEKKIVGGKNGYGAKCISEDTKVHLMYGNVKFAKDLTIDDKLVGENGKYRNIKNIITGSGKMYQVNQQYGEPYKVNENHILTLHMPLHRVIRFDKERNIYMMYWLDKINKKINLQMEVNKDKIELFAKTISKNNKWDISIQDYLQLPEHSKLKLEGYKISPNKFSLFNKKSTGNINILPIEDGNYVGIEIDGNQRFLINDFTVTHNCANIFSSEFIVETVDSVTKQKYHQRFYNNMYDKDKPIINKCNGQPYTKITFKPDFKRFHMEELDKDIIDLMTKRVYDIAAFTDKSVSVYLNDEKIMANDMDKYANLFLSDTKKIHDVQDRWEVILAVNNDEELEHISFVNGIYTYRGGKHVEYVSNHIARKIQNFANSSKRKKKMNLKQEHIKKNFWIFLKSTIENPGFSSQTKEELTTDPKNFGSKYEIDDKLIEKFIKTTDILSRSESLANHKDKINLDKSSGKKTTTIKGIPKLDDANWAGTKKSDECTLIITEGDSAKTLAVAGLSVVGMDKYGIFPIRGKLLNTREATKEQLVKNEEINNIIKILGLKYGEKYENTSQLRYGHILIFTDQDLDGSHIKGLITNFIHTFWPSLLKCTNFIVSLATPIVKISKGNNKIPFYTLTEYNKWKDLNESGWKIKYYKGLGTSTRDEAQEYFEAIDQSLIKYYFSSDDCNNAIKLAFAKENADKRKEWLGMYDSSEILELSQKDVSFYEFIHKDLKHFSNYDIERSIQSICDGLKPSQRKILFSAFKRNLKNEIKVAQFAGYVSEHTAYHHGEKSLQDCIIGLAQNFVGSNNVNLLEPKGQFGTRILGGKDAASSRYIFTQLSELTLALFNKNDNNVLNYLSDDDIKIEPKYYLPILPLVLMNGNSGIGTGYSTDIPSYNPIDLANNIKKILNDEEPTDMIPWYRGFTGKIHIEDTNIITRGNYTFIDDNTLEITELPVEMWTENYKIFLESCLPGQTIAKKNNKRPLITSYLKGNKYSDTKVHFIVKLPDDLIDKYQYGENNFDVDTFEKDFKLTSKLSTRNMHLFDRNGKIKKYNDTLDILKDFHKIRLEYYHKRKIYMLLRIKKELDIIEAKVRFLNDVINEIILLIENKKGKKKSEIIEQLDNLNYPKFSKMELSGNILFDIASNNINNIDDIENNNKNITMNNEIDEITHETVQNHFTYDYLLEMPIYSLTEEKLKKLQDEYEKKEAEYTGIKNKSEKEMWIEDIDNFVDLYSKNLDQYILSQENTRVSKQNKSKKVIKKKK